jgi:epoxyqueuosine reductase QueG
MLGSKMKSTELAGIIKEKIVNEVKIHDGMTSYREPIIGFVAVDDPGFSQLSEWTAFEHLSPDDLLPGARSVVSFFLPFTPDIPAANAKERERVAREWAVAYVETNAFIGKINSRLIEVLGQHGVMAGAEPATGNFDEKALRSHWSHKSIAVLEKERCEYYASGSCLDCVIGCPVNAIDEEEPLNRQACWKQCLKNGEGFLDQGDEVHVCGKCAVVGPCVLESGV